MWLIFAQIRNMKTRPIIEKTKTLLTEALDEWKSRHSVPPDHLSWSPEKPHVLWLCGPLHRMQVVLDRDVTQAQVLRAQRRLKELGDLVWDTEDKPLAC